VQMESWRLGSMERLDLVCEFGRSRWVQVLWHPVPGAWVINVCRYMQ
jgi:hypothetical protein